MVAITPSFTLVRQFKAIKKFIKKANKQSVKQPTLVVPKELLDYAKNRINT